MANLLKEQYPNIDIAIDEVKFTEDSDQPYFHLDSADFWGAGLVFLKVKLLGQQQGH